MEPISNSPLTWPAGWRRTESTIPSRFGQGKRPLTIAKAIDFVLAELKRKGIGSCNIIISTNLKLRLDGYPYSNQKEPQDKGVSVWWKEGESRKVIALDKYNKVADNLYAIGKTIEAMRGIDRWGSGEILERVFDGFVALPNLEDEDEIPNWMQVLDYFGDDPQQLTEKYKIARSKAHPDNGGSNSKFNAVVAAYKEAKEDFGM